MLPCVFWSNLQPENAQKCSRVGQNELQPNAGLVPIVSHSAMLGVATGNSGDTAPVHQYTSSAQPELILIRAQPEHYNTWGAQSEYQHDTSQD